MDVEPAHIDQLRQAQDGRMVLISADAGGVAEDLRRIDPCLKVRFAEAARPPCWIVRYESVDGRETYLVDSFRAYQNRSGVWEGLDQRIVRRMRKIAHDDYDFAGELQKHNAKVTADRRAAFREKVGEAAGPLAHALRRDLGIKNRAFIPK
jgi:hypothetical protein